MLQSLIVKEDLSHDSIASSTSSLPPWLLDDGGSRILSEADWKTASCCYSFARDRLQNMTSCSLLYPRHECSFVHHTVQVLLRVQYYRYYSEYSIAGTNYSEYTMPSSYSFSKNNYNATLLQIAHEPYFQQINMVLIWYYSAPQSYSELILLFSGVDVTANN